VRLATPIAALAACVLASSANAAMTADQIGAAVAARYGVEVLRVVEAMGDDGRAAWRVTVMNPGGDFNEAFQVNTILVDAETGAPIVQFRHLPSGTEGSWGGIMKTIPITEQIKGLEDIKAILQNGYSNRAGKVNDHWAKQRIAQISATISTLRAFRIAIVTFQMHMTGQKISLEPIEFEIPTEGNN